MRMRGALSPAPGSLPATRVRSRSPGDYFTFEIAGESLFASAAATVRRCAPSTTSASTARISWCRAKAIPGVVVCPYHAWTYELTGELRAGPNIKSVPGFDRSMSA